jgi:hypothetical protein
MYPHRDFECLLYHFGTESKQNCYLYFTFSASFGFIFTILPEDKRLLQFWGAALLFSKGEKSSSGLSI